MKNIITEFQEKNIVVGKFPVTMDSVVVKTAIVEGDIVGLSSSNTFGKYDEVTYTTPYGVAYNEAIVDGACSLILTGEISREFVVMAEGQEEQLKNLLRKISIFIK